MDYREKQSPRSPDRYYYAVAYDEKQGIEEWWQAVQDAQVRGEREYVGTLLQTILDKTLRLTPLTQAACAFQQGRYYYYIRQMDASLHSYERSLALYLELGERLGEANVRKAIGDVQRFRRELGAAMENYQQALALHREVGDPLGEANDLKATGDALAAQEEQEAALGYYRQALTLYRQIKNVVGEANVLRVIADTYHSQRDPHAALEMYHQSLGLYRQIDSKLGAANILESMHKVLRSLGKPEEAEQCYQQALALYRQMHMSIRESRDETRLAVGTMVVDSALPWGGAGGLTINVTTLPAGERMVDGTFIGQAATLPKGEMGPQPPETPPSIVPEQNPPTYPFPMGPATLPPGMPQMPDTPIHSPNLGQQLQQVILPLVGPPLPSPFSQNTLPRGDNAPVPLKSRKKVLQKLAEYLKFRRSP